MARKKKWDKVSKQICVEKGKNSLLELQNCLKPSSPLFPWRLHAQREEDEEGKSLIRLVMVDYWNKDENNKSISVYANIEPVDVKYLFWQIVKETKELSIAQQKIYQSDKQSKKGTVTYLFINRWERDKNGKKRENPWHVQIQNGTGTVAHNKIGGQYCKGGTYKEENRVDIYLTDQQMFNLFAQGITVVLGFELDAMYHRRDVENFKKLVCQTEALLKKYFEREGKLAA